MDSIRSALKQALAADHDRVDAAFGAFDLSDAEDYARFLRAHARALFAVEAVLATHPVWPAWRPRAALLHGDFAELGQTAPPPYPDPEAAGAPAAWGMLYVLEGSRLGGRTLAPRVSPSLPRSYLSAVHLPGEWRDFLTCLEERFAGSGIEQLAEAEQGARCVFALFARAAAEETGSLSG